MSCVCGEQLIPRLQNGWAYTMHDCGYGIEILKHAAMLHKAHCCKQASQPASQPASKQASKQARKQASNAANLHA